MYNGKPLRVYTIQLPKSIDKLEATAVLLSDLFYSCQNRLWLRYPQSGNLKYMTELLQRVIAELEKLPQEEQNAIATRLLAELEDEQAWKVRFEATTDDQWDSLAQMVRREIVAGDVTPLADVFPSES